jgi:hypothetical protein
MNALSCRPRWKPAVRHIVVNRGSTFPAGRSKRSPDGLVCAAASATRPEHKLLDKAYVQISSPEPQRPATLTDRLPADLRAHPGPAIRGTPFKSLYQLDNEFAAEMANKTVHGVIHLGWVPDHGEAQMTVLVRPNGVIGRLYMLAIRPLRYLSVYPVLIGDVERTWRERTAPA